MLTRDERLTALITNLRQYEPKVQYYFQLESEDVPIILSILENLEKIEQEPTQSPIIDWNKCHTSEQLDSISTTKNDLGVDCKTEDYIDRMDTINTVKELYLDLATQKAVIDLLKVLPSVTPQESRWISVSERLPKENICDDGYIEPSDYVLVWGDHGNYGVSRYWGNRRSKSESSTTYKDWMDLDWVVQKPIAWQPLPKPYKKDIKSEIQRFKDITSDSNEIHTIDYILSIFDKHISGKEDDNG